MEWGLSWIKLEVTEQVAIQCVLHCFFKNVAKFSMTIIYMQVRTENAQNIIDYDLFIHILIAIPHPFLHEWIAISSHKSQVKFVK